MKMQVSLAATLQWAQRTEELPSDICCREQRDLPSTATENEQKERVSLAVNITNKLVQIFYPSIAARLQFCASFVDVSSVC